MANTRIAIIGGGISGLSTAVALQRKGIYTEVFEKEQVSSSPDTGMVLSGNAIRAFYIMGLGSQLLANGIATDSCFLKSDSGDSIAEFNYHSPSHIPNYLFIQRSTLYKILIAALLPGTFHLDKQLIDFSQNKSKIYLRFNDGAFSEADYLIGCDGAHSQIRTKLMPESKLDFSQSSCWRGMITNSPISLLPYTETWGPRGRFGIAPLPGNRLYWYAFKKSEPGKIDMAEWNTIDLLFNFFYYHDPIQQILENTPSENIIYDELYELKALDHLYCGNILLIGDSAHASMPNIGQGASQAIEDAVFLAKWISTEESVDKGFARYESHKLERMRLVKKEMQIYGLASQVNFPLLCTLRNKLLQMAPTAFHNEKLRKVVEIEEE